MEKVTNKVEWLRSFKKGDVRKVAIEHAKDCHRYSVLISRWNYEEGRDKGIRLSANYNSEKGYFTITANPI